MATKLRIDLPGLTLAETTWEAVAVNVLQRPAGGLGNGCCEKCGRQPPRDPHHRWLASQGGPDVPSNLVALCGFCHSWCHRHPAEAEAGAWIIQAPWNFRDQPIRLWNGMLTRLDDMYGYDVLEYP
jgi:hypothetical protein